MSQTISIVYQKAGATFASGEEAYADKNSLYPPEAEQHVTNVRNQLLESNILLAPESYTWDQATHELSITRVVSSATAYYDVVGPNSPTTWSNIAPYSQQAGWTYLTTRS